MLFMPLRQLTALFCLAAPLLAQEWQWYAGDAGGAKYSPLKDVHRANVGRMSLDSERGILFISLTSPSTDFYGNQYNRTFGYSLVAFAVPEAGKAETSVSHARPAATQVAMAAKPAEREPDEVFSHPTHAPKEFACTRCHATARTGDRAGFPTGNACAPCHAGVPKHRQVLPPSPVYRLPAFVQFSHARHAKAACRECHGDVWTQDPIEPVLAMKMKACVDCHQSRRATVSCTACHELSR